MFKMISITHICTKHLEGCLHQWVTKEPELLSKERVVFEPYCDSCFKRECQEERELGGELHD